MISSTLSTNARKLSFCKWIDGSVNRNNYIVWRQFYCLRSWSVAAELFEFTETLINRLDHMTSPWSNQSKFLVDILLGWGMGAIHVAQSYLLRHENILIKIGSDTQSINISFCVCFFFVFVSVFQCKLACLLSTVTQISSFDTIWLVWNHNVQRCFKTEN